MIPEGGESAGPKALSWPDGQCRVTSSVPNGREIGFTRASLSGPLNNKRLFLTSFYLYCPLC